MTNPMPILEPIEKRVCEVFGVSAEDLKSKRRFQRLAEARFAFISKIQECHRLPSTQIGAILHRNHTSIIRAVKRCEEIQEIDPHYAAQCSQL